MTKSHYAYGRYRIAAIQPYHIESIRLWRNDQMDALRQKHSIAVDEQITYFKSHVWPSLNELQPRQILVAISYDDELIGYGGLVHIDWEAERTAVSFLLNPDRVANKDLYQQDFLAFLILIKGLAFNDLGFHRIFVETYSNRLHHISILEEFGFSLEGIMRDHIQIDGVHINSLIHGYISTDEQ